MIPVFRLITLSSALCLCSAPLGFTQESDSQEEAPHSPDLSHLSEATRALIKDLEAALIDASEKGETLEKLEHIGDLYTQLGEAQRAVIVYDKAIRDFGGTEQLYLKFARVLLASGKPDLALKTLQIGHDAFPDSNLISQEMGKAYLSMRKAYAAQAIFKKLIEEHPENDMYRYYLADSFRIQKKWDEALGIIEGLIEEDFEYIPVYLMKGDLLLAMGEMRDGVRYLEDVYEEHPDSGDVKQVLVHAYQLYAYAESDSGRLSRAIRSMRDALEVEPENGETLVGLASFLSESGEHEEAEKLFKETLETQPQFLEAYVMYGKMLDYLDRKDEAHLVYLEGLKQSREMGAKGAEQTFLQLLGRSSN